MLPVRISKHAKRRLRQRHPGMTGKDCADLVTMAIKCGAVSLGKNGCKKYKFLNKEFVIDDKNGFPLVVTVI